MNPSANPCEDFFEYSCGTWIENHIIPEDKSSASTFSDLRDDVSATLKREWGDWWGGGGNDERVKLLQLNNKIF